MKTRKIILIAIVLLSLFVSYGQSKVVGGKNENIANVPWQVALYVDGHLYGGWYYYQ